MTFPDPKPSCTMPADKTAPLAETAVLPANPPLLGADTAFEAPAKAGAGAPVSRAASAAHRLWVGTALALGGALMYGLNVPAARAASQAGIFGADLIFYRALILLAILGVLMPVFGQSLKLEREARKPMGIVAVSAAFTALFYLSALDYNPVPITVVLFFTFPFLVMLLSNGLERRPLSGFQVAVFSMAFIGLIVAVGPSLEALDGVGMALALAAACGAAVMFLFAGKISGAPLRTLFYTQLVLAPMSAAFAFFSMGALLPPAILLEAPGTVALVMLGYLFGFLLQLAAVKRISPTRTSLLFLAEPLTAILVAGLVLGESLNPLQLLGVAVIFAALVAEIVSGPRRQHG